MSKAKTASKNSPSNRGSKVIYFYKSKEVIPSKFYDFYSRKEYTCIQDKSSGEPVINQETNLPLTWNLKILTKKI